MAKDFKDEYGNEYEILCLLGSGGQGKVWKVKNRKDDQIYAVKWYHNDTATSEQYDRIDTLINKLTAAPFQVRKGVDFLWPIVFVYHEMQKDGYGFLMPLIDIDRFISINKIKSGRIKQPDQKTLCQLSYLLCVGMQSIHHGGFAYCDININNIMFDPNDGHLVICDNDNVVCNNSTVQIIGVQDYMAPEIALDQSKPNAQSDLYSIAILLYQLWMWEHPMEGWKTNNVICWDAEAKNIRFAVMPLFVHHPTDKSNSAEKVHDLAISLQRWNILCPPVLQVAFTKSFTEGVHEPVNRIQLSDWQRLFLELEADAALCPFCKAYNLIDITLSESQTCFNCHKVLPLFLMLSIQYPGGKSHLVVYTAAELRGHHIEIDPSFEKAREIVGVIEAHPAKANIHGIRNKTKDIWSYEQGGHKLNIEPNQVRPLLPGGIISIGQCRIEIIDWKKVLKKL